MKRLLPGIILAGAIIGNYVQPTIQPKNVEIVFESPIPAGAVDDKPERTTPTNTPTPKAPKARTLPTQEQVATKVRNIFTEDPETAVAVFRAESGLRPDAKGWNCRYNGVSRACNPEDRANAWSVDCGVAQINVAGHECPAHLMEAEGNLQHAYEMYKRRHFQPWVAYNNGKHLPFLQ